jgi:hypothetical protein
MTLSTPKNHAVSPDKLHPATVLLKGHIPSLAGWYAAPMTAEQAESLLLRVQCEQRRQLCQGCSSHSLHILQLIAHFWAGRDCSLVYRQLAVPGTSEPERALLDLVYGQLLISRKLQPALRYLATGFAHAAPMLASTDYIRLVRQHELLAYLSLSGTPASAQDLPELLREAAVIRRLRDDRGRRFGGSHLDTIG